MTRKVQNNLVLLLGLIILGGFSYHLLFEAKARYVIPYILLMIPLSIYGIQLLYKKQLICEVRKRIYNKLAVKISPIIICIITAIYSFYTTTLPTVYFEGYTDTQTFYQLTAGLYYSYPVDIHDKIELTSVSILTYNEVLADAQSVVQLDIINEKNEIIKTTSLSARQVLNQSWTIFTFEPVRLDPGTYKFQFTSNNPKNNNFGIILGNQYSYVNQENILVNGYDTKLQGNIKIYKNH